MYSDPCHPPPVSEKTTAKLCSNVAFISSLCPFYVCVCVCGLARRFSDTLPSSTAKHKQSTLGWIIPSVSPVNLRSPFGLQHICKTHESVRSHVKFRMLLGCWSVPLLSPGSQWRLDRTHAMKRLWETHHSLAIAQCRVSINTWGHVPFQILLHAQLKNMFTLPCPLLSLCLSLSALSPLSPLSPGPTSLFPELENRKVITEKKGERPFTVFPHHPSRINSAVCLDPASGRQLCYNPPPRSHGRPTAETDGVRLSFCRGERRTARSWARMWKRCQSHHVATLGRPGTISEVQWRG